MPQAHHGEREDEEERAGHLPLELVRQRAEPHAACGEGRRESLPLRWNTPRTVCNSGRGGVQRAHPESYEGGNGNMRTRGGGGYEGGNGNMTRRGGGGYKGGN
eukprot:3572074-Pyramimonas_sp.AAC.1